MKAGACNREAHHEKSLKHEEKIDRESFNWVTSMPVMRVVKISAVRFLHTHTLNIFCSISVRRSTIEERKKQREKKYKILSSKEMNLSREESYYEWLTLKTSCKSRQPVYKTQREAIV